MAKKSEIYDVGIVGYGPAGITSGIYAARKNLRVVLIGDLPGGEVRNSGEIENWTGSGTVPGNTLADSMVEHLKTHSDQVDVVSGKVTRVSKKGKEFLLTTESGDEYMSKTVIYAAGRHPRPLNVPGEEEFRNKGVTYCATCDAPLFPDREVAVVGGGNTGAEAVIMLMGIAKKIYLLHNADILPADSVLVKNFENDPKVEIVYNAVTKKIEGDVMVERLVYTDGKTKEDKTLNVQGVFVNIGAIPNTKPVEDLVDLNTFGAIPTDRYGKTEVDGFFAAGDVTDIRDAQIIVAAGHGCSASLSAGDYLSRG